MNILKLLTPSWCMAWRTSFKTWSSTRVKIARVGEPAIDGLILFGGATRERPDWTHGRGEEH